MSSGLPDRSASPPRARTPPVPEIPSPGVRAVVQFGRAIHPARAASGFGAILAVGSPGRLPRKMVIDRTEHPRGPSRFDAGLRAAQRPGGPANLKPSCARGMSTSWSQDRTRRTGSP
jgi:hypothetical protein